MSTVNTFQVKNSTGRNQPNTFSRMEAIASGVQARVEESTGYSKKVIEETINIARALGVADSEIERWATHRLRQIARDTERLREIKSLLDKIYGTRFGKIPSRGRSS